MSFIKQIMSFGVRAGASSASVALSTEDAAKVPALVGGAVPVTGTILLDATELATLKVPTKFAAVTPSDSTDLSATATKGLLVTVTGLVYVQGTGDSGIISLGTIPAGTVIPGSFLHVGASTTATVVQMGG